MTPCHFTTGQPNLFLCLQLTKIRKKDCDFCFDGRYMRACVRCAHVTVHPEISQSATLPLGCQSKDTNFLFFFSEFMANTKFLVVAKLSMMQFIKYSLHFQMNLIKLQNSRIHSYTCVIEHVFSSIQTSTEIHDKQNYFMQCQKPSKLKETLTNHIETYFSSKSQHQVRKSLQVLCTFPVDMANSPNCFHLDSLCTPRAIACKAYLSSTVQKRIARLPAHVLNHEIIYNVDIQQTITYLCNF